MKKFIPLNVSSKFAICGLPLRLDTYKYCTFGCKYCFANNREIMSFDKTLQKADFEWLCRKFDKVFRRKNIDFNNFLEVLLANDITLHCGGMSDPFQPCEQKVKATERVIEICNYFGRHILFSTKSNTVWGGAIRNDLHTFQLSITGADKTLEPNVPDIQSRIDFYRQLKQDGFKVGIRLQPFIPGVTTLDVIKPFYDADNFTLEGIKIVPQNEEAKNLIYEKCGLEPQDFTQMGLLNLKPEIRTKLYKPFIEYFEDNNIPFSIADNDLHYLGTNFCCCGDKLVHKSTGFDNTAMIKKYGIEYAKEQIDEELFFNNYRDCECCKLFTSNRQEGCVSVQDFYDKRFYRKSSPFSPQFLYQEE